MVKKVLFIAESIIFYLYASSLFTTASFQELNIERVDMEEYLCCLPSDKKFKRSEITFHGKRPEFKQNLIMIMPTILRTVDGFENFTYIVRTVNSIMAGAQDIHLIILIGHTETEKKEFILNLLLGSFKNYIENGNIHIIELNKNDFIKPNYIFPNDFKDSDRQIIKSILKACKNEVWTHLKFSAYFGDIGVLYPSYYLKQISGLHRAFYQEQPCDMLRFDLNKNLFRPLIPTDKNSNDCPKHLPFLFKHIGEVSSYIN
ncbi:hypothetical protein HZS_6280 [Henneguya salminicola]|nr:hypothetical protein HZS_6280 [Henneguya salminicola]